VFRSECKKNANHAPRRPEERGPLAHARPHTRLRRGEDIWICANAKFTSHSIAAVALAHLSLVCGLAIRRREPDPRIRSPAVLPSRTETQRASKRCDRQRRRFSVLMGTASGRGLISGSIEFAVGSRDCGSLSPAANPSTQIGGRAAARDSRWASLMSRNCAAWRLSA